MYIQLAVTTTSVEVKRRAVSVNEMVSYNNETGKFSYIPLFEWDPGLDIFNFRQSSQVLENKIGKKRGNRRSQLRQLYKELEMRQYILEAMVEERLFDYYEVFNVLQAFKNTGKLPNNIMTIVNKKVRKMA